MFGRRWNEPSLPKRVAQQSPAPQATTTPAEPQAASQPRQQQAAAQLPRPEPVVETQRKHSEEYYDVKTTVFNALIDTIDLTQLAKLDSVAAREEIRDIVSEIIQIKNVVMSISEQEELLEDICNDVLGLWAARTASGSRRHRRHHGQRCERDVYRSRRQSSEDGRSLRRQSAADEYLPAHRQPGRTPRR